MNGSWFCDIIEKEMCFSMDPGYVLLGINALSWVSKQPHLLVMCSLYQQLPGDSEEWLHSVLKLCMFCITHKYLSRPMNELQCNISVFTIE